jgi:hypothetical protein
MLTETIIVVAYDTVNTPGDVDFEGPQIMLI